MNILGITTAHIQYLVFAVIVTVALLLFASILRIWARGVNYALLVVFGWAALINFLFIADFLELSTSIVGILIILSVAVLILISFAKYRAQLITEFRTANNWRQLALLFTGWLVALGILIVPLAIGVENRTTISGHFVSNDSVIHAIFARGFEFTRTARPLADYYNVNYPRGIHSFFFYSDQALNNEGYETLLPAILFTYSFVYFAAYYLVSKMRVGKETNRYIIALAPVLPYLVVAASYNMFAAQIAVVPLMIAASTIIMYLKFDQRIWLNLLAFIVICLAAFSIYSVLPISVIAVVVAIKIALSWWQRKELTWDIKLSKQQTAIVGLTTLLLIVLAIPSLMLAKNMISPKTDSEVGGGLLTSFGNLPGGFLDPLHVTGIWPAQVEYRGYLINEYSHVGYLLLIVFAIQVVLIAKAKLDRNFLIIAGSFLLPCVALLFVVRNQYIQFKYLTFFIPLFALAWMIGVDHVLTKLKWYFAAGIMLIVCALFVLVPLRSYRLYAPLLDFQLAELNNLHDSYLAQGSTLILSREDWFQYFVDSYNDYAPMTLYIPQKYPDTKLDFIIVDGAYQQDVKDYLETKPAIKLMVTNPGKCLVGNSTRFQVIDVNCFGEN